MIPLASPLLLSLLCTDLFGPGSRPALRNQFNERPDGSSNTIEYAIANSRSGTGFSTIRTFVTRRTAGLTSRQQLTERDVQLPPENLRVARLPYQFAVGQTPAVPNRIVFLSGASDSFVRSFDPVNSSLGRAIAVPSAARLIALRPTTNEAWTVHSGGANQIAIVNLQEERAAGSFPLRLNAQALPLSLSFSPDGRLAWLLVRNPDGANERGVILLLDCVNRQVLNSISLGSSLPSAGALNPDGTILLILGSSVNESGFAESSMLAFDTNTNGIAQLTTGTANLSATLPSELYWHPDSTRAFYLNAANYTLEQYDLGARRVTRRISIPRTSIPATMDISPTGDFAIVRDTSGVASLWLDLESGEVLDSTAIPAGPGFLLPRF